MLVVRTSSVFNFGPVRIVTFARLVDALTAANNSAAIKTPRVSAAESARIRKPAGNKPITPTTTKAKMPMAMVTSTRLNPLCRAKKR